MNNDTSYLLEQLPVNAFIKDINGCFVFANTMFCNLINRQLNEIRGKTDHDLFPKECADKYINDDKNVILTQTVFSDIESHTLPNGRKILVNVIKKQFCDSAGKIVGVVGFFWDVTNQFKCNEINECTYKEYIELQNYYVFSVRQNGEFVDASPCFQKLVGRSLIQLRLNSLWECTPRDQHEKIQTLLTLSNNNNTSFRLDFINSNQRIYTNNYIRPITSGSNCLIQIFGRDINDGFYKGSAEEQNARINLVNYFAETVAHDVKKSIDVAVNYIDELYRCALGNDRKIGPGGCKHQIDQHLDRAVGILDQIQELSRREDIICEPLEIMSVIEELRYNIPDYNGKDKLVVDCRSQGSQKIIADRKLVIRAFMNVVKNSIDASARECAIQIVIRYVQEEELCSCYNCKTIKLGMVVEFLDNGTGIPEKRLPDVCKYGYTTKNNQDKNKGQGIGLWFCNNIMPIFGGVFVVDNRNDGETGVRAQFVFKVE